MIHHHGVALTIKVAIGRAVTGKGQWENIRVLKQGRTFVTPAFAFPQCST